MKKKNDSCNKEKIVLKRIRNPQKTQTDKLLK